MKDKKTKKSMKENYNAVHNILEQHAALNVLRDIFSEAMEAEKIIASKDTEIASRDEHITSLEKTKENLKDTIEQEYQKFQIKKSCDLASLDTAWEDHNKRVAEDRDRKLGLLEAEVKKMITEADKVRDTLSHRKVFLEKVESRIKVRESQLKSIDDQINKLKEAIA